MIMSQLMDLRTPQEVWTKFVSELSSAAVVGLDCETQDEGRHAGLNAFNNGNRHVFDHRRTVMTGFSVYPDGADTAYYFNLAHADVENRLPKGVVAEVVALKRPEALWIAHNAPFELVMFFQCHGIELSDIVCTLQMAVSDHGPDEYDIQKFYETPMTGLRSIVPDIITAFGSYDKEKQGRNLNADQQFVLGQFVGKESEAAHSYNGFVDTIAWGYSLKALTKSFFGAEQTTFQQVLGTARHMGELTGEQVCAYGADDAYWAVRVYHHLVAKMMAENPKGLVTFLERENPMIHVYADTWREGLRVNIEEVFKQRDNERHNYAEVLKKLKAEVRQLLPFPDGPNAELIRWQAKWYEPHWQTKRAQITTWANTPDTEDDFAQCFQVSNPVGNAWATEEGIAVPKGGKLNLTHYYAMRVLLHDLLNHRLVRVGGEIKTDKEARSRMLKTFEAGDLNVHIQILKLITEMSEIEQRMKLYLTPYTQLTDPETGCMYSVISSMLATRRMAARFPNPMQLAKRGTSTYVRGFYLPDQDNHVIVSADWSSVELVEIGEFSGDPEFASVFGQRPYGDLHSGAAVDCLRVDPRYEWLSEDEFLSELKRGRNPMNRDLRDFAGKELAPDKWVKFMRTEIGKGANFNYWYSGALGTVGEKLGWDSETMWAAVERYRNRFAVAEKWRTDLIGFVQTYGYAELPDHHRRVRFEATNAWATAIRRKFADVCADPAVLAYADLAVRRIQTRAGNQAVNAYIQGMCARLAKDSVQAINRMADRTGFRFMLPIHDELVFSVHRDYVPEFVPLLRQAMCTHPDYFKRLPLDCTVAIGRTFKPYDSKAPWTSQIELDEAPVIPGLIGSEWDGKALPVEMYSNVVDWVMDDRRELLAA